MNTRANLNVLRARRRIAGFTLLEMMIVLVLVAGVAALLAGNLIGRMASTKAGMVARQVAAAMRYTRAHALRTRQAQVLQVDLEGRTVTAPQRRPIEVPEPLEIKLLTATQETSGRKAGSIRFFPDGGSTGGKLTLMAEGRTWEVAVSWLTGEISVNDSARPRVRS
jgi:general secretion pathway protein H